MDSTKTPLLLIRYTVRDDGTIVLDKSERFEALINPAEFKHSCGIEYDKEKAQGESFSEMKFAAVKEERVSFALVLDGTGVVPGHGRSEPVPVKTHLAQLNKIVYQFQGSKHETPHVRLLWGTFIFFGRLESMSTQYTLFKPSGEPLRAKVDLAFVGAMSKQENALVSNLSSPDLSHRVLVREGDTLPLLCHRIYGDAGYYLDVARHNGLAEFRRLQAGSVVTFPPLE